jgi:hypothetical protein
MSRALILVDKTRKSLTAIDVLVLTDVLLKIRAIHGRLDDLITEITNAVDPLDSMGVDNKPFKDLAHGLHSEVIENLTLSKADLTELIKALKLLT